MDIQSEVGRKIKEIRQSLGISQEELSFRSEKNVNYISNVERGTRNVSLKVVKSLADALEVDIIDFFEGL